MHDYDLIVIGGGAAGIFAAVVAAQQGLSVCVLEKRATLLSKVKVSGGGRCNVTHACFDPKAFAAHYPRGSKELLGPLHRFGPQQTIDWFAQHGVELKAEEDGRMFPITNHSETIIQCLLKQASVYKVEIRLPVHILQIEPGFRVHLENKVVSAPSLLLATGSASEGYAWAQQFGHTLASPVPSLFTLNCPSSRLLSLSGICVQDARLSVEGHMQRGALLLTHFGFSGPAALKLSAWAARSLHDKQYHASISVDWIPQETIAQTTQKLLDLKQQHPHKFLSNLNWTDLSKRLWDALIDTPQYLQQLPDRQLIRLSESLHRDVFLMEGKTTHKEEFVTCGGVKCEEIDFAPCKVFACQDYILLEKF